jgi:RNA polymerase sigma-70 factor (ECF subfamily)
MLLPPVNPDFQLLVDRHYAALYRFALSLSGSGDAASDLVQQTFYLWAEKGHQLRDASKAKSWLFTTLYREYLSTYRRNVRHPQVELDEAAAELPSIAPEVLKEIDGATVVHSLTEVDEVFRAPLTLFYLEELSYKEIADVLNVPIGTIMSRLSRGKEQLRNLLLEARGRAAGRVVPFPQKGAA